MDKYRMLRCLKVLAIVVVAVAVFGFVTMHLWNWLMPAIFGLKAITFGEALGLVILSKILFGGFHRHGGGRGGRRQMQDRWATNDAGGTGEVSRRDAWTARMRPLGAGMRRLRRRPQFDGFVHGPTHRR